ncbi:MAG: hypothetical protein JWO59_1878 [Chloroflexi bacterium]|nr:hypothetical protein [Chloroflexota bacterium]
MLVVAMKHGPGGTTRPYAVCSTAASHLCGRRRKGVGKHFDGLSQLALATQLHTVTPRLKNEMFLKV